ncbi:MAG: beta-ketoacyl synthase N-terminal-like domain-containing protein [bacterium]|nr:beta-ketoacyl synthase N-terminal-like domain-containing protein [bacterium]
MQYILSSMTCACALGRTNADVLANGLAGSLAGMVSLSGDIPGREVYFGLVPGELPAIAESEFDMRTNQLLLHAVRSLRTEIDSFLARYDSSRVAIVLGASNTGIDEAQRNVDRWLDEGAKPSEMQFSQIELGTPTDYLKHLLGVKGPAYTVSTACSSSTKAFAAARRLIELGIVDAAIVGGVDGRCRFAMNGFHALGALAQGRCRPLAEDRDGINLGEGVALFTMERGEKAEKGERVGVCLAGCGESSDAYHATAPDPEGHGAETAMRAALADAGMTASDIAYLNLHGTGTLANDSMEMKAVGRVFNLPESAMNSPFDLSGIRPVIESTKSMTGHCLGAAGAIEAAICWLYISSGHVKGPAMSNSFAFGGSNASVILAPWEAK